MKNIPNISWVRYIWNVLDFDYWITDKKPDPDLVEALKDRVTILYDGKDSDYE